jgi:ribonuclease G
MQAAFVDIGLNRSAFLYVTDAFVDYAEIESMLMGFQEDDGGLAMETGLEEMGPWGHRPAIEELLHEGQDIVVQVSKEPIGTKGARLTSHISLPGRHLVLMPTVNHVGVSRRIEDDGERRRLRETVSSIKPPDAGFIVRTAGEGKGEEELRLEVDFLLRLWESIQGKKVLAPVPSILHQDLDIALRAIRDLYTKDVQKVVVDTQDEYHRIVQFIETFMPQLRYSVELYERREPIFDAYGIEVEISRALDKRVWLKSGGYIVIEETEALVAIDVNTGKYVGKGNPEDTILKTNLEAVKEIAYQLRLRNIGGIIIIDFIDMAKEANRQRVLQALKEALKRDKAKTSVYGVSELGLVQMTRKRTRESLTGLLCEPCSYCEGKGFLKSKASVCCEIFREVRREALNLANHTITISLHPEVADLLYDEKMYNIEELEQELDKNITVKVCNDFHLEQFEIVGM